MGEARVHARGVPFDRRTNADGEGKVGISPCVETLLPLQGLLKAHARPVQRDLGFVAHAEAKTRL
jgi:hypothetical protein